MIWNGVLVDIHTVICSAHSNRRVGGGWATYFRKLLAYRANVAAGRLAW